MRIIQEHAGVRTGRPLNSEKPKILAGVRANGESIVVKLLFTGTDDARPLEERKSDIEHEVVCCTALAMAARSIALVPHEVVKLNAPQEFAGQTQHRGEFRALLMPRYFGSITSGPSFSEAVIAREARRLLDALQYMQLEAGFVHMDVKLDNVFFDNSGWFLGDFGSSCKIGEPIRTTTATFYHGAMAVGAHPRYDWFMLLVLVLIELGDKEQWSSRFMDTGRGRVSYEKVMSDVSSRSACRLRHQGHVHVDGKPLTNKGAANPNRAVSAGALCRNLPNCAAAAGAASVSKES